jgi:N-acetylglucosamine-6-phosphate deacetylase
MPLLRHARIVLPDQIVESADLLITNDRIAQVIPSASNQSIDSDSVIDVKGLTLFPGFIDVHIHGALGVDTMAAGVKDLTNVGEFLARHGVTGWLPTLVPASAEEYGNAINSIGRAMLEKNSAATILGVHYEGPFVNQDQCGALHQEHFRNFNSVTALDELPIVSNNSAVHMMTLAPEVEGGINLIKELKQRGWIVSIGHTRATREVLDQALAAGANHMTHFMNAMTPLHHRQLGAVGWGLIHDDVTCDIIADGIHIDRSMLQLMIRTKRPQNVSLISDAIAAAGMPEGDYEIWGERISVAQGRTRNNRGSIAGSVITMLDAVRLMLSLDFSECDVAQMASLNPAKLLGLAKDRGSLEEGKRADLVALDKNQTVQLTIIGGEISYQA